MGFCYKDCRQDEMYFWRLCDETVVQLVARNLDNNCF